MNSVSFNPLFSLPLVALILFPAFAYFISREIKSTQKYFFLRVVALTFILFSFLGLFLRPSFLKTENGSIVLTAGYEKSKVDSLINRYPKLKIIRAKEAAFYFDADPLSSWNALDLNAIKFVVGEGLPMYVLELIRDQKFQFIPCPDSAGITNLVLPNSIYANRKVKWQGVFNAVNKTKLKIVSPGGPEDSIEVKKGKNTFALSFTTKQAGLFGYTLTAEDSVKQKSTELLPIAVLPEQKLKILFLQKFPTAEVQHLKNYLAQQGAMIALRYQTSKNNFINESINMSIQFHSLTDEVLRSFDLLFIDEKTFNELSFQEERILLNAIREGLGAIVQPEIKTKNRESFFSTRISQTDTAHVQLPSSTETLPVDRVEVMRSTVYTIYQNKNRILSGYRYYGKGKIGFQSLQETYRLRLKGNWNEYGFLWASLIENTAREKNATKINLISAFPHYSNEPIEVEIISSREPTVLSDSIPLALSENVIVDEYWTGKSWSGKIGWHELRETNDSVSFHYFVSAKNQWRTLRRAQLIEANKVVQSQANENLEWKIKTDVPLLLYYLIFIFAFVFLWLVPKL